MTVTNRYADPDSGVEYAVRDDVVLDLADRIAIHSRAVTRREPGGAELIDDPDDVRIEVDPLVGRLPGERCFYQCQCPDGVHREDDDDD